jgi:thiosulfate/3-mercaptopyruvate sulfurtransferase
MHGARRIFTLSIVAAAGLICWTGSAVARESPYGSGVVKLVSTEWLQNHLRDTNLIIVDAQADVYDYLGQHLPGAVYLNDQALRAPDHGMPVRYLGPQAVEALFNRVGLSNDTPVVVYTGKGAINGTGDGLAQTMVAYTLARFGQNHVYVLDGGLDKWVAEKRPVTKEYPKLRDGDFHVAERHCDVTMGQLKELMTRDDVIIIDARGAKAYEGQAVWSKGGHIPGAISLPWRSLMADDNPTLLKSDHEIAEILKKRNITPDKTIVTYCGTGREATNPFLLFKCYLGFPNVKLYEGSFTEWSAYPDNPTVVGPNPK